MKINERKIRETLTSFSVPAYDPDALRQTIRLAKKAYSERLLAKRIGCWEFIAMQVRFIGRGVWLAQAALLLACLYLLEGFHAEKADMQSVFLLLSSIAPLIAFVGFPEILKSYSHNMEEIEACTRFSMRKLMGARMLILGLADLFSLTLILTVSAAGNAAFILRMILYLFVPFNLTCCLCMTVLEHFRGRYAGYACEVICVGCTVLFLRLSLLKKYYEAAATGTWMLFFCLSGVYLTIETVRVFRSFSRTCFSDETLSAKWK